MIDRRAIGYRFGVVAFTRIVSGSRFILAADTYFRRLSEVTGCCADRVNR